MNKWLFLIFIFWNITGSIRAQERTIGFESSSNLAELFQKAKQENKLMFVDGHTQWCDQCRLMEKNVFVQEPVIRFFDEHFVNVCMDMGKGEGLKFAEKYGLGSFPVFLFLDAEGNVRHKAIGYRHAADFIAEGKRAMDPKRCLAGLTERYENGEREVEFLLDYALVLKGANMPEHESVSRLYLETTGLKKRYEAGERDLDFMEQYAHLLDTLASYGDLQEFVPGYLSIIPLERMITPRNWRWFSYYASNRLTEAARKVILNPSRFVGVAGSTKEVDRLVAKALVAETNLYLYHPATNKKEPDLQEYIQFLRQLHAPIGEECLLQLTPLTCLSRGDFNGLLVALERGYASGEFEHFSREKYFQLCLEPFRECPDREQVEKGMVWVERLIREEKEAYYKERWGRLLEELRKHASSSLTPEKAVKTQKQPLTMDAYNQWKKVAASDISEDGRWAICRVEYFNRSAISRDERKPKIVVRDMEKGTSFDLLNVNNAVIFADSKWLCYQVQSFPGDTIVRDSVIFMNLQTGKKKLWTKKYICSPEIGTNYVTWKEPQGKVNRLCMWNILTNDTLKIDSVERYSLYDDKRSIFYIRNTGRERDLYTGKLNGKHKRIHERNGSLLGHYCLDKDAREGTFTLASDSSFVGKENLLYAFTLPEGKCRRVWDLKEMSFPDGFELRSSYVLLENGGKFIFPELKRKNGNAVKAEKEKRYFEMELWRWNDDRIPSRPDPDAREFLPRYVYHVEDKKWVLMTDDRMKQVTLPFYQNSDYALMQDISPYLMQMDWNEVAYYDLYLKSLVDGSEHLIERGLREYPQWSPSGKYAVVYHARQKKWYALEVATRNWRVISDEIPFPMFQEDYDYPEDAPAYGVAGWMKGRDEVILQDKYDLWVVDLTGKQKSYCLTKGYGRESSRELRLLPVGKDIFFAEQKVYEVDERKKVLIRSRDLQTKYNGIYYLDKREGVKKAVEGEYSYHFRGFSKNGKRCIWTRQNYRESPDLWCSDADFSNAVRITRANAQQESFLWGSEKLVTWTTSAGKQNQGLLLLPENFDSTKTYPTIVTFYEKVTHEMHYYPMPQLSSAKIDIPTYVSQGYVVFIPDIHYRLNGSPGEDCLDAVVSGTEMLIRKGIADRKRIGVQGHSWGGSQLCYLLTRTDLFCCAQVGAGVVNAVSAYTALRADGSPRMYMYEKTQSRIGKTLWEAPEKYLQSTPILQADKITSPLLILHNDRDGAVPFVQGRDLFLAMRRLQKPAWLMNYKGEQHFLSNPPAQADWSVRMQQFFDYYLKNGPLPEWMKNGI